jgi:cyanuric acid amidohydrolase
MKVGVHRISMDHPGDVSGLRRLINDGEVDPEAIVACIGKTEGNGGANDFTRALATAKVTELLSQLMHLPGPEILERVALVWSGGCEGVLSPHMTVFTRVTTRPETPATPGAAAAGSGAERLAMSVQRTRSFLPEEVGRTAEVLEVAAAVRRALDELRVGPGAVHYVQVKGPLLTPAGVADAAARGQRVVTEDPNRSKAYARGATALGVGIALGEIEPDKVNDEIIAKDMSLFSAVTSTSAGGELTDCEVIVFANSAEATGEYRIGHGYLEDAVDVPGVRAALRAAGLEFECEPDAAAQKQIAAVFAKAEAPRAGACGDNAPRCSRTPI